MKSAKLIHTASLAVLVLLISSVTAQYSPPRNGGQPQPQPRGNPNQGGGVKPFRFAEDEEPQPAIRQPATKAGTIRPVGGQSPINEPGNVRPAGGPAIGGNAPQTIPCPWEKLSPQEQQSLDELMNAWEQHSSKIERYRCTFKRWEYDPIFGPKNAQQPKTYGQGKLLYSSPDKGLFEVESLNVYMPPAKEGVKEEWKPRIKEDIGEHWVCDGKRIFEFDARQKKLMVRELPPQMQGKAIVDGPLPFLFGAKAAKIEARYWLRLITPGDVEGEQWIEAVPKFAADAKNFKMVHVIIDEKDFLPKAIQVFDPAFHAQKRPIRTVYTFDQREFNWNITLQMLNLFHREFYEPGTPIGWTKVVEPFAGEPGKEQPPAKAAAKPNPFRLPFKLR